jgi:uncharacterized membrane protein YfcA
VTTIIIIGLLAGFLIGVVGIGGVIVVPALTYLMGLEIQYAIAAALMGFIITGIVGTYQYAKQRSIQWRSAGILVVAAIPAALLGSLMVQRVSPALLKCLIGVLAAGSGLQAIFCNGVVSSGSGTPLTPRWLATVGGFTSFFSTVSGTGGPLILVPILMWQQQPLLGAIGLSQVIQLPISIVATLTNLAMDAIDPYLGGALAIGLAVGCWFGAAAAHHLPAKTLKFIVSGLLVLVGAAIVADVVGSSILS